MAIPTRRERVVPRLIEDEMRDSFLDYSMSVIVQRALPDVRDGLKPVHRRILHAMNEAGLAAGRPYKKSATVVGDVLGKYHPHGDMAVYEALVRMVQDFSLRYPLVDGQGNFGSIDGDNAAAYRYTEARLAPVAMELLGDIERATVDFAPNFDDRLTEPTVLPARFPNLLVNGSSGIAVGMATNIPPHNLREIAAAVHHLVRHPDCAPDDLMRHVPGPDFPTGAYILGKEGIDAAYRTGRGRIVMRAAVQKETRRGGREQLVVTALPYGVSKAKVIEQVADVARSRLPDISDLRDESDRDGMRIVIELKRDAKPETILATLYKQTHLQATFGTIMLALDHGVPRELNLKELLERFRDHRLDVIRRRARFDLEKAQQQAHILEGLVVALENIDLVIAIIRESRDEAEAARELRAAFELSEAQAHAILEMRLRRLTALETEQLKAELRELRKLIRELQELLGSPQAQLELLLRELDEVVKKHGDARRTTIVADANEHEVEDLVADEQVVITLSHQAYIRRVPIGLYRRRVSSGKALAGMDKYEEDFLEHVFVASTSDTLVFCTEFGQAYALDVRDVPEASASSRGRALAQVLTLEKGDRVAALIPVADFDPNRSLLFLTASGTVKRTSLDQYASIRSGGIAAIRIQDDDYLLDVQLSDGTNDVVLVTSGGRAIRFPETDVPVMGRIAQGVRGMQLRNDDSVIGMVVVRREATLCTITAHGFGKRTRVADYPAQRRGGIGTITLDVSEKTGLIVGAKELLDGDELMIITASGAAMRVSADDVPMQGRATQGKRLVEASVLNPVVEVSRAARDQAEGASRAAEEAAPERIVGTRQQLELIGD
ncbi:MAG: DNA gyrase subunit A [Gemmatimonadetes bacterium]|nr:DNA gyrase subunit A [Gemmatimonadota bacterium]